LTEGDADHGMISLDGPMPEATKPGAYGHGDSPWCESTVRTQPAPGHPERGIDCKLFPNTEQRSGSYSAGVDGRAASRETCLEGARPRVGTSCSSRLARMALV